MNNTSNKFGGLISALLFVCGLTVAPAVVHAQEHITNAQAVYQYNLLTATHRSVPEAFAAVYYNGEGVTIYPDGSYRVDGTSNTNPAIQAATYEAIMSATGDPTVAAQGADGLLTPDELQEALWGGKRTGSYMSGSYHFMVNFPSMFCSYTASGGGGGGGLQN